jgi:hypothetical protein
MTYLNLLLFFPFAALARSNSETEHGRIACASIEHTSKVPQEIEAIGVFFPTEIENAKAAIMSIDYVNNETLLLGTSVNFHAADDHEIENNATSKGYSLTYFYLNVSQVHNVQITIDYHFPKAKEGGMMMCGSRRNYKLSDLLANKNEHGN